MSPQFRSLVLTLTALALVVIAVRLQQQGIHLSFWRENGVGLLLLTLAPVAAASLLGYLTIAAIRWLLRRP